MQRHRDHHVGPKGEEAFLRAGGPQFPHQLGEGFARGVLQAEDDVAKQPVVRIQADGEVEEELSTATMRAAVLDVRVRPDRGGTAGADPLVGPEQAGPATVAEVIAVLRQRLVADVAQTGIEQVQQPAAQFAAEVLQSLKDGCGHGRLPPRGDGGTPFPTGDDNGDAVPGPQRDRRPRLDGASGTSRTRNALADRRQHQHRLHHREGVADADARPAAEREVGELRQPP